MKDDFGWIQTYTGRRFSLQNTTPGDIFIEDIAHALAHQCRYAGHCLRFYSVAEHSVHLWSLANCKREALMHDATEAYLVDVPRSVKPLLTGYKEWEHRLSEIIAKRFDLIYPWPEEVHQLDTRILLDERAQNMAKYAADGLRSWPLRAAGYNYCPEEADGWPFELGPLHVSLHFWTPAEAEDQFLKAFHASTSSRH